MRRERLLLQSRDRLNNLRESPFKIFIRAKTWEPIGIMTKKVHKYDSSWGTMRLWAVGLTLDGVRFEEPLDRKNRRTGELEDVIQMETDLLLITARCTGNPDDDDEDNFQYFLGPHQANRSKDMMDRIKERDRIIHDMEKKISEAENQRDYYEREAEAYGSEIRTLKSKVGLVTEKLADSEAQADHYRTLVKKAQTSRLEAEGQMDEKMSGARERGAFEAKDSADIIVEAAKKQKEAKHHLTDIGMGGMSPEYATKSDLKNMERKIDALVNVSKANSTVPTDTKRKVSESNIPKMGVPIEEET